MLSWKGGEKAGALLPAQPGFREGLPWGSWGPHHVPRICGGWGGWGMKRDRSTVLPAPTSPVSPTCSTQTNHLKAPGRGCQDSRGQVWAHLT